MAYETKHDALRRRAEQLLDAGAVDVSPSAITDLREVLHELHVHQVELDMQNDELRRTRDDLAQSRARFEQLFQDAPVGYVVLDRVGRITQANRKFCAMLSREREAVQGASFAGLLEPDSEHVFRSRLGPLFRHPGGKLLELSFSIGTGVMHARIQATPQTRREADEHHQELLLVVSDVTDEVASRKRADHLASVLLAIRRVNQLIAREKDRSKLLEQVCELAVQTRGYHQTWIALIDPGEPSSPVSAVFDAGFDGEFQPIATRLREGWVPSCAQRALSSGEVHFVESPLSDCPDCPIAARYPDHEALVTRLTCNGRVAGWMTVAVTRGRASDPEEQALFAEMAEDLSNALTAIESEHQRRLTERKYAAVVNATSAAVIDANAAGVVTLFNPGAEKLFGVEASKAVGAPVARFCPEDLVDDQAAMFRTVREQGALGPLETERKAADGSRMVVEMTLNRREDPMGGAPGVTAILQDITARKQADSEREVTLHLLRLLNGTNDLRELIAEVTLLMREWSGCEAVGVRLQEADDFPYFVTRGFPPAFVESERHLCQRLEDGTVKRDRDGNPLLECMCGNVIRGRFDPKLPFFTEHGSFWTNSTTELLGSTSESDRQARTRNRCHGEGYESVALVPLRHGEETLGLLQFNDSRRGLFDDRKIALFERLASSLAIGLSQRRAMKALAASEDKFSKAFHNAPVMMTLSTIEEGRYVEVNDTFVRGSGYARETALGVTSTELGFITPDARRKLAEEIQAHGFVRNLELELRRADGEKVVCLYSGVRVDVQGEPRLLSIAADITGRKRAVEALRRNQANILALIENTDGTIWSVDREFRLIVGNAAFQEVTFRQRGKLFAAGDCTLPDDLPEPLRNRWRAYYTRALQGESFVTEDVIPTNRGDVVKEHRFSPIRSVDGSIVGATVFGRDITERKRVDDALRQSERQKALILNATAELVSYYEEDLRIVWCNHASCASVGKTPDQLMGHRCHEVWHQSDVPCSGCPVIRARETGHPCHQMQSTPDGREWMLRAYPVLGDDGKVLGVVEFGQDVTEKRKAESERVRLQEQLLHAQKLESVGRLAGGVAHDFNNMLSVIIGNADLALSSLDEEDPNHDLLQEVVGAAERSADLTRQLLAFARKQTVSPRPLDLNEAVAGTLKMLRRLMGEDIELVWKPGAKLWTVEMDPSQLDQLLANLCVNARDAITGPGTVTIETRCATPDECDRALLEGADAGDYVVLAVTDTGCGMDAEILGHLFEPFFTTKQAGKGTGLGLATVYGIAKQNGGFVEVNSKPHHGSRFSVFLPRRFESDSDKDDRADAAAIVGGNETILLVEDEPAMLRLNGRMLRALGYRVLAASGPKQAIDLAREHSPGIHLLLTDVIMPEMDGRQLASQIRIMHPDVKVLFMSGYPADAIADHGVLDEGLHFLAKPFAIRVLAAKVRDALG